ncbi:MAG: hypothetical protein HOP27_10520 [Anaerolineales bacterium]|nr:hypothetical protein [Anaerolineales bacterium]
MKFQIKHFISALLTIVLLAGWVTPAYAADVTSITPTSVVNDADRIITVAGTGFDTSAVVLMDGSALITSFLNDQTLTATVPAGTSTGTHIITVTMTGGPLLTSFNLNVTAPVVVPTATPTATGTPLPFTRPQLRVTFSGASSKQISSDKPFKFTVNFENAGNMTAFNTQAVFSSADLVPLETGGVAVLGNISAGGGVSVDQRFTSQGSLSGKTFVIIDVALTYYDDKGTSYSDKFTLNVPTGGGGGSGIVYPTSTPTGVNTAQLVITSYASTVDPLQPGEHFQLGMTVQNMGNTTAKSVTMIVGGGSSGSNGGTPQPGGVSGGSGEFTNFAPVGSSNIQSLGDVQAGGALQVTQNLIVNVSTNPGAYPIKITFSYVNKNGEVVNDDQVITLLVYSLPNLDVSFYRPPDPFFAGQPGPLPIQIVNLSKRTSVLGSMKIESEGGTLDPASTLVGSLDPGGYFTFDSTLFPDAAGPMQLTVTIDYTDDFNQARTFTRKLDVTVEEAFVDPTIPDPSLNGGEFTPITEETFFQKAWRFVLGLFGLDSAPPADSGGDIIETVPGQEVIPIPSGGGGGKG